jgi:tryptophan synthase beta chain
MDETVKYLLSEDRIPKFWYNLSADLPSPAPLVSHIKELGLIEAKAYHQIACFDAGIQFAQAEGILPAPEANHAVRGAIDEALEAKRNGKARVILFNLCGHGHFDMQAYMDYHAGKLTDQSYREAELAMALAGLPVLET